MPALAVATEVRLTRAFAAVEKAAKGRLGVAWLPQEGAPVRGYRQDERFPMCSTFKALLTGAVLARVDRGDEELTRPVRIPAGAIVAHSPLTSQAVGGHMSISQLCEAIMLESDNGAANLLLQTMGGPRGLNAALRKWGDRVTRLDRMEPEMNDVAPGDPRDTTTPAAMIATMRALCLEDALRPASRERLQHWMVACRTGRERLRAGLPPAWKAGDKTGTGVRGTANDVAVVWPVHGSPFIVSAYLTGSTVPRAQQNAAIAEVGRLVAEAHR